MMNGRVGAILRRITATFSGFTTGQKAVTIAAVAALAIGGYFFSTWASAPSYAPLFSNLAGSDASAIVDELSTGGTPYKLADGGQTVMVPQDQVYDLRLKMSGKGLPAEQDTGYALLDKQGVTTSEFMQHIGYQRALEGELSKTIKSIDGVTSAAVHLAMPDKDVFSDDAQKPTASVLVGTEQGKTLSAGQVQAVSHLVASSVEGMDPTAVTVVGADGTVLAGAEDAGTSTTGSVQRDQQTQQFESRMNTALQQLVNQLVGAGHAVVKVTADLDYDQTETKSQTYVVNPSAPPLAESKSTEKYTGSGTPAGGVLGPDNIQVPAGTGGNGNYEQSNETRNNALGTVVETRKSAPGAVRRLAVAVLLDERVSGGVENSKVQELISAAAGLDKTRGDAITVAAMPFEQTSVKANAKEAAAAKKAESQNKLMSMAKTGGLALVILILIVAALLASRRNNKHTDLTPDERVQLDEMQAVLEQSRTRAISGSGTGLAALEVGAPANPDRDSQALRRQALTTLVERQPEDVARLLRGWLAEQKA